LASVAAAVGNLAVVAVIYYPNFVAAVGRFAVMNLCTRR
jgi:hypothetical protein